MTDTKQDLTFKVDRLRGMVAWVNPGTIAEHGVLALGQNNDLPNDPEPRDPTKPIGFGPLAMSPEEKWKAARPKMVAKATWTKFRAWADERYPNGAQDQHQSHSEYVGSELERALQSRGLAGKTLDPGDIGIAYLDAYDSIEWSRCRPKHLNPAVWAKLGEAQRARFGPVAPDELMEDQASSIAEEFFEHLAKGRRSQNEAAELVIAAWGKTKEPGPTHAVAISSVVVLPERWNALCPPDFGPGTWEVLGEAHARNFKPGHVDHEAMLAAEMVRFQANEHGQSIPVAAAAVASGWDKGQSFPITKPQVEHTAPGVYTVANARKTMRQVVNHGAKGDWSMTSPEMPWPVSEAAPKRHADTEGTREDLLARWECHPAKWECYFESEDLDQRGWKRVGVGLIAESGSPMNTGTHLTLSDLAYLLSDGVNGVDTLESNRAPLKWMLDIYNAPLPPKRAELTISVDHGWD